MHQFGPGNLRRSAEIISEALAVWSPGAPAGVGVTNLDKPHRQLALWDDQSNKKEELTKALTIYGNASARILSGMRIH
jgi:hypothetical protein